MSPMERAIFWIEYTIRNGPDVLRSPVLDYSWWQLALIDIYGFTLSIIILIITVSFIGLKLLMRALKKVLIAVKKEKVLMVVYENFIQIEASRLLKKTKQIFLKKFKW